jgi:iron complex outermembrane receptor protein
MQCRTPKLDIYDMNKQQVPLLRPLALSLALALPGLANAQTAAAVIDSTVLSLGEVVVTSGEGPLSTAQVLSSVNIIPAERFDHQVVNNNWQLFEQVPGVMLTQFGQGTSSGKLSMRGFNGEGEINAVKLLIDGIPSNSNDGNMPYIDLAPRLDIESLEVVKGTNDPRYGLHNIAGNVNISTKRGGNYAVGRASVGSYGSQEVQATLGIDKDGTTQNYAFSQQHSNGYRDHAKSDSQTFSGKWFTEVSQRTRLGLIARYHDVKAEEPGYLTATQINADSLQSPLTNAMDEGRRRMNQVAVQVESELSDALYATGQVYRNEINDRRFVRFTGAASQQERFVGETHVGASTQLTWRLGQTALGNVVLSGGLDTERQSNHSDRYNTVAQVRTSQTRDQQFEFNTTGGFVQAVIKPTARLTVTPALRVDTLSGSYTNRLNGITYDMNNYGLIKQPKLSAIYALMDTVSVYGNWGRTFQVGVGTASYKVTNVIDLEPSINEGWEFGTKFRPAAWLDARVAVWDQTASNEARRKLNDPSNASENIGKTQRQGLDIELNARPSRSLSWWGSASFQRSEILQADAASLATTGKEIDHIPRTLYGIGVDYQATAQWRLSTWLNGQSDYYIERTNAKGKFGAYTLLNASASYQITKSASLDLQIRNLTDRYYEYVWYDADTTQQPLYARGTPRTVFVSLTVRM